MRLAPIFLTLLGCLAFFAYVMSRFSAPGMSLLYTDLDARDSGQIVQKLESLNIPVQVRGDGNQILVPSDQVGRLRMLMAQEGLPKGGSVGYEIFDKAEGLGTSNFVQSINHVRALEGELARTIGSLSIVRSARVHLVLPARELFSRDKQPPSASIVLQLRSAIGLERAQIAAIQHLVAAAVPNLQPNNISIVDDQGNLLARGSNDNNGGNAGLATSEEMRMGFENRLAREVETLLEKSFGNGAVRAQVSAEMNFDRQTISSETYDPEGRVARSQQTVEETQKSQESGGGAVSVQNNLPEGGSSAGGGGGANNQNNRTEETVNYEISKTVKQQVREGGEIKRLSVAVLVDGTYTANEEGKQTYAPRNEDELKKIEGLIKTAIGFNEERGDKVEIVNLQFKQISLPADAGGDAKEGLIMGFTKQEIMRLAELLILAVLGILALLIVVKPILSRLMSGAPMGGGYMGSSSAMLSGPSRNMAQLPGPSGGGGQSAAPELPEVTNSELDEMINMKQIEGRIKASSLKRLSEIVEKHPEETLSVVRTWLYEGSNRD
ncbi:MAG: flagellar basal-body MS-ring/collar protein FliF [Dongiaceae bacterium]